MKHLPTLAALAASALFATSAHALIVVVDDFSDPTTGVRIADTDGVYNNDNSTVDGTLRDNLTTALATAGSSNRQLSHRLDTASLIGTVPSPNFDGSLSSAGIGGLPNFVAGQLNMANAPGVDAEVDVSWALNAFGAAPTAAFSFSVITNNNGNLPNSNVSVPNIVEAFFNGASLGVQNMSVGLMSFSLSPVQAGLLANAGNSFRLLFNGAPDWDASIDNLTLTIPEPGTLLLAGLAALGAGLAVRRKKA